MLEPKSLMDKLVSSMKKRCGQISTKLIKHKFRWLFNKLVNMVGLGLHDYHKIVKQLMDLGGEKSWLDSKAYLSPLDFVSNVWSTFSNIMFHNPKDQDAYYMLEHSLCLLDEMFYPTHRKFEVEVEKARHRQWPLNPIPATSRMTKKSDTVRGPFQAQMPVTTFFFSLFIPLTPCLHHLPSFIPIASPLNIH